MTKSIGDIFFMAYEIISKCNWAVLLMEEILHHLKCVKPCKSGEKNHAFAGEPDFWTINSMSSPTYTLEN